MSRRSLSRLSRQALLSGLDEAESRQRSGDADVLAHLGEVGCRRLYAQLGYSSLFTWCVHARHYSEDVAVKRIRAARAARRFPVLLDMLADGRLHLTAIELLLAPADAGERAGVAGSRRAPEQARDPGHAGGALPAGGRADRGAGGAGGQFLTGAGAGK